MMHMRHVAIGMPRLFFAHVNSQSSDRGAAADTREIMARERQRPVNRKVILTLLALPLAFAIGLLIGVMSETSGTVPHDECVDRTRLLASRYRLQRPEVGTAELAVQRLQEMCQRDPIAFSRLMRTDVR